jgi:hypothetical protein
VFAAIETVLGPGRCGALIALGTRVARLIAPAVRRHRSPTITTQREKRQSSWQSTRAREVKGTGFSGASGALLVSGKERVGLGVISTSGVGTPCAESTPRARYARSSPNERMKDEPSEQEDDLGGAAGSARAVGMR